MTAGGCAAALSRRSPWWTCRQPFSTMTNSKEAMSQSDKGVDVEGIGKSFGSVAALRDISFDVGRGEVVALLGPNGAGKTTTVEILSTLATPDRGRDTVAGHDV